MDTVNIEPFPASLATSISPPISSHKLLLMANPSPVPPYFRVVEVSAWEKGLNKSFSVSAGMPMPLSSMLSCMCMRLLSWVVFSIAHRMMTRPWSELLPVNLMAFPPIL